MSAENEDSVILKTNKINIVRSILVHIIIVYRISYIVKWYVCVVHVHVGVCVHSVWKSGSSKSAITRCVFIYFFSFKFLLLAECGRSSIGLLYYLIFDFFLFFAIVSTKHIAVHRFLSFTLTFTLKTMVNAKKCFSSFFFCK